MHLEDEMNQTTLPMNPELYEAAPTYDTFVQSIRAHQQLVSELRNEAAISEQEAHAFADLVQRHGGTIHVSVLTEDRCSDSATNLPIVEAIVNSVPGMDMKVFHIKTYEDLNRAYNDQGLDHIPVLTFYDAKWKLIGHWVERPAAASEKLAVWKAAHADEIKTLEGSEDLQDKRKLRDLYRSVAGEMASWYRAGLWDETVSEIRRVIADGHL
jgi:hypothetical protein